MLFCELTSVRLWPQRTTQSISRTVFYQQELKQVSRKPGQMQLFLFANDAAITTRSVKNQLISCFSPSCKHFEVRFKNTQVTEQDANSSPDVRISNNELEVVHDFMYTGLTSSDSLCLDAKLNKRILEAATAVYTLTKDKQQAACLHSLRPHRPPARHHVLDLACLTGAKVQHLSCVLLQTRPEHHIAGQSDKQHCSRQYVHAETVRHALAWSHGANGQQPD